MEIGTIEWWVQEHPEVETMMDRVIVRGFTFKDKPYIGLRETLRKLRNWALSVREESKTYKQYVACDCNIEVYADLYIKPMCFRLTRGETHVFLTAFINTFAKAEYIFLKTQFVASVRKPQAPVVQRQPETKEQQDEISAWWEEQETKFFQSEQRPQEDTDVMIEWLKPQKKQQATTKLLDELFDFATEEVQTKPTQPKPKQTPRTQTKDNVPSLSLVDFTFPEPTPNVTVPIDEDDISVFSL